MEKSRRSTGDYQAGNQVGEIQAQQIIEAAQRSQRVKESRPSGNRAGEEKGFAAFARKVFHYPSGWRIKL
jgi:hypothetical protein